MADQQRPQHLTPLWVISLFVSLTEVVTGVAVTQASGSVQVALTTFVIAFPLLVAAAFFLILWFRPYVLYPPAEFGGATDVESYVRAMRNQVETEIQVEVSGLRARVSLDVEALLGRVDVLEKGFSKLLESQQNTQQLVHEFEALRSTRAQEVDEERAKFRENSQYKVVVAAVTPDYTTDHARAFAVHLAARGYDVAVRGWNGEFYLSRYSRPTSTLVVIAAPEYRVLAARLSRTLREVESEIPIVEMPIDIAAEHSVRLPQRALVDGTFHAAVAYCPPRTA